MYSLRKIRPTKHSKWMIMPMKPFVVMLELVIVSAIKNRHKECCLSGWCCACTQ